jgi:hypothetical protein
MEKREKLVEEIESLMSYGEKREVIERSLLKYLDEKTLLGIRDSLQKRHGVLKSEDREWLSRFVKE